MGCNLNLVFDIDPRENLSFCCGATYASNSGHVHYMLLEANPEVVGGISTQTIFGRISSIKYIYIYIWFSFYPFIGWLKTLKILIFLRICVSPILLFCLAVIILLRIYDSLWEAIYWQGFIFYQFLLVFTCFWKDMKKCSIGKSLFYNCWICIMNYIFYICFHLNVILIRFNG